MSDVDVHLAELISNLKKGDPVPVPPEPCSEKEVMSNWRGDLDNPLVSIVCLTYNHASFVKDALNGFLMQKTDFPFEVIVHDDASNDGTINILHDYASRYPKLFRVFVQEENQYQKGMGALGFAFPLARGKYIAYCEGDDYWIDEKKIFKQASYLESNCDVSIVYANSISFSGNHCLGKEFHGSKIDLKSDELKRAPAIFTLTACFRNVLDNPIELNYAAFGDKFIWSRLGGFGRGKYMQNILPSFYRVHAGGVHSMVGHEARLLMDLRTSIAMSSYYRRIGDVVLEKYFLERTLVVVIGVNGISAKLIPIMRVLTLVMKKMKKFLKNA